MYSRTLRSEFAARRRQRIVYLLVSHVFVGMVGFLAALDLFVSIMARG